MYIYNIIVVKCALVNQGSLQVMTATFNRFLLRSILEAENFKLLYFDVSFYLNVIFLQSSLSWSRDLLMQVAYSNKGSNLNFSLEVKTDF